MKAEHPNALRLLMQDDLYLIAQEADTITQNPGIDAIEAPIPQPENLIFKHAGNNNTHFLVIVNTSGHDFLEGAHLKALHSSLERKGLKPEDIALLNINPYPDAIKEWLISFFNPEKIWFAGVDPGSLGWKTMSINTVSTDENLQLLYSYSFSEMVGNKEKIKAFWDQMKIF